MSPYVERASILARMGRALRSLPDSQLDNEIARFAVYRRAGVNRAEMIDFDAAALASQRLFRAARRAP